jgi:hypothetical protein
MARCIASSNQGLLFIDPHWWTPTFGWTAFIPMDPFLWGIPFDALTDVPPPQYQDGGYVLPAHVVDRWSRLEDTLLRSTIILAKEYSLAAIRPFYPWYFSYHKPFKTHRVARKQFRRARDWFFVWMGLLSCMIASGKSLVLETSDRGLKPIPRWFEVLEKYKFDQVWLAGVNSSVVCSFRPETRRVGLFVHLLPKDTVQPSIAWYCDCHVPVWYPWSHVEARFAQENPFFAQFAPLPEQLQMGTTILVRDPSLELRGQPQEMQGQVVRNDKPLTWKEFFIERDNMNARRLQSETPVDCQRHLAWEANLPTTSAKVFEWNPSLDDAT